MTWPPAVLEPLRFQYIRHLLTSSIITRAEMQSPDAPTASSKTHSTASMSGRKSTLPIYGDLSNAWAMAARARFNARPGEGVAAALRVNSASVCRSGRAGLNSRVPRSRRGGVAVPRRLPLSRAA